MGSFLVAAYLLAAIIHLTTGTEQDLLFLRITQAIGVLVFGYEVHCLMRERVLGGQYNHFRKMCGLLGVVLLLGVLSRLLRGEYYMLDFIYPISSISIASIMLHRRCSLMVWYVAFYGTAGYMFFLANASYHPSEWVYGSANHVSVVIMSLSASVTLYHRYLHGSLPVLPSFVAFVLSLIALGRAGILATGLMLLGCILVRLGNWRSMLGALAVGFPLLVFLTVKSVDVVGLVAPRLQKFQKRGLYSDPRMIVIEYYLDKLDGVGWIVGSDISELEEGYTKLTTHNSFLNWHIKLGMGFFLLVGMCFYVGIYLFRRNMAFLVILVAVMVRGATDEVMFIAHVTMDIPFTLLLLADDPRNWLQRPFRLPWMRLSAGRQQLAKG